MSFQLSLSLTFTSSPILGFFTERAVLLFPIACLAIPVLDSPSNSFNRFLHVQIHLFPLTEAEIIRDGDPTTNPICGRPGKHHGR